MSDAKYVSPIGGGSGGGGSVTVVDVVEKGNQNPVSSQGVYNHINDREAVFGRFWNESLSQSKAAGYFGSLDFGKHLIENLGLGRYLVTDDRRWTKLKASKSTEDVDGRTVALDGTQGQCIWGWFKHYYGNWQEVVNGNTYTYEVVSLLPSYKGHKLIEIPRGGVSWLSAGVWDAAGGKLCSLISDDANYRGGGGSALSTTTYTPLDADMPQCSMLGMPRTEKNLNAFSAAARLRGEGWEANWFVARAVVEYLMRIYFGNRNSQAEFNASDDTDGLPQGGLGSGVAYMPYWNTFNGYHPLIPNAFSIKDADDNDIGDFTGVKTYVIKNKDNEIVYNAPVPFFAGLMNPYAHLYQLVNGVIVDIAAEGTSDIYVTPSMAAAVDQSTVADKLFAGHMARTGGYIKKLILDRLCGLPSEVGGSASTYYADYLYTIPENYNGKMVRLAGGRANNGADAGASYSNAGGSAAYTFAYISSPLCVFNDDPKIE